MTEPTGTESNGATAETRSGLPSWLLPAILGALLVAMTVFTVYLWRENDTPSNDSADAGFARDMTDHHAQAVEMALIAWQRSDDPEIQQIAYDIATSQQAQIGMMQGWLTEWGLSLARDGVPMAWAGDMDHDMEGASSIDDMPGMATREEIDALRTLEPEEMDREFLRLMIAHHQGGVLMADAGVEHVEKDVLHNLASSIASAQQLEITTMQTMLDARETS
ncbi:MAG: DUF305 domain-containing protein [Thermomicrobiales bacterium]|nr:DUF305 domain-containing protein [Thermomicrobiales bacterium]